MAVVLALALIRFFRAILSPLIVAAVLIILADGVSRIMQRLLPAFPKWLRGAIALGAIIGAFAFVVGLAVAEAPAFAAQIKALAPKIDNLLAQASAALGAQPVTLEQALSGLDTRKLLGGAFGAARHGTAYAVFVIIYFGFLAVSRARFAGKFSRLYVQPQNRAAAMRVLASVTHAVDRYAWLQTLKALAIAAVTWLVMTVMGVHDALFAALLVFLSAYVPIIGAVTGSVFPGLMALSQFNNLAPSLVLVAVLASAVFVIDNVVMPKLQGDELNLDPLIVLISLGFWAAILGAPGVLLSTPLTVTMMAISAEFEATRWLAVLLSRDGRPGQSPEP